MKQQKFELQSHLYSNRANWISWQIITLVIICQEIRKVNNKLEQHTRYIGKFPSEYINMTHVLRDTSNVRN